MPTLHEKFRDLPIRHKLGAINLVTTGLALCLATAVLIVTEFFSYRQTLLEDVRVQAAMIGENSAAALVFNDARGAQEILSGLAASPSVVQAAVFDARGTLLAVYRRAGTKAMPPAQPDPDGDRVTWRRLEVFHGVRVKGERTGTVYVHADLDKLYARILWYAVLVTVAVLAALAAALLLLGRLQHGITGPLMRLVGIMREVSQTKNYAARAAVDSRDEVGALASGFNAMLIQIEGHQRDLTQELQERKRAEQRLDYLAHYDTVTHLPNRHFFNEKLKLAIPLALGTGNHAALLFIDLDNFKIVNDTLGHQIGDRLLKSVAERLGASLRRGDMICRIGGDEFAVILEGLGSRDDASMVAQKLHHSLSQVFVLDTHEIFVSASIGISVCPDDGTESDTLLRHADTAMYYAKERGKNNFQYFQAEMTGKVLKRLTLETHLRRALEREEFTLYYQPQYDLKTRGIVGVEALLRWRHPELGVVNPGEFIPVAEETGLIVPIGEWVLRTACRQWSTWKATVGAVPVAVNVSGRQFQEDRLVDLVLDIVAETGIESSQLTLELTESTLMDNSETMLEKLRRFERAGIQLSIDDFGTGYSSMSYLTRFPVNTLKIDRSFVRDIPGDADDVAIAKTIIAMGESLNLKIVAEGVENLEQVNFLQAYPSVAVQGYYFSRPVPVEALTALLQEQQAGAARAA